jgi:putative inorganic carbon (HCO3(-)) transporter
VIWMVDRHRVSSMDEATAIIRRAPTGKRIEIEALHHGDPLPVVLTVTDEIKARANPLGLLADGRTRRFRISGFTRHFITYADQMQILGLFSFGGLIVAYHQKRRFWLWFALTALFTVALVLTAARAAIAAYLLALIITAGFASGRRLLLGAVAGSLVIGAMALSVLVVTRQSAMARFDDPSSFQRLGFMRAGLRVIPAHPLLGVGMDSHKRHWSEWGFPGEYITHTHSTPIQLAMDRGLPALGFYIWLMLAAIIFAWREFRRRKEPFSVTLALGTLAALIGFNLGSLVNYNFGDAEVLLMLLALFGLVVATKNEGRENDGTLPAPSLR